MSLLKDMDVRFMWQGWSISGALTGRLYLCSRS